MKTGKRCLSLLLSVLMVLGTVSAGFSAGAADQVYEISNYEDLVEFAQVVNGNEDEGIAPNPTAHAILRRDITANGSTWEPIANSSDRPFAGTFDGRGHKITGLDNSEAGNKDNSGLFGFIGEGGSVENVRLESANLKGSNIGGIAHENNGTIQNCSFDGSIESGGDAGGIACNNTGTITGCYSTGSVSGSAPVGGIAGDNRGTITNCYNTGAVRKTSYFGGGIVGENNGTVADCYNTGDVTGNSYVGGILGSNMNIGTLTNSYNTGSVTGNYAVGGIAGYMNKNNPSWACSVTNCYSAGSVTLSGENAQYAGGVVGYIYNNCTVENCYYDSGKCTFGAIDGADDAANSVTGLSTDKMTGETALDNMPGLSSDSWLVRANDENYSYYPHLRGFAYDSVSTDANWPAKTEYTAPAQTVFEISNYEELNEFAVIVNGTDKVAPNPSACAVLTADIECKYNEFDYEYAKDWVPIAKRDRPFTGVFDGRGHKITGLDNSEVYNKNDSGLFGFIGESGSVKNVRLINARFEGVNIGGIAHENRGTIQNCSFDGSITCSYDSAAGIAGTNYGTLTNCYNTGSVSGSYDVGGIAGKNYGTITNCYNTGDVSGTDGYVGGIAGDNKGTITNCYNTGSVTGSNCVGGIAGDSNGTVSHCYNTGSVSGNHNVGGVLGGNYNNGTLTDCFNTGSVTGNYDVGGIAGYMNKNNPSWACSVTNSYNTGSVTLTGEDAEYAGGVVGLIDSNCDVANCYYDSGKCSFGAIDGADDTANSVTGLTTAQMTGTSALESMTFSYDEGVTSPWLTKENADGWAYYPHLSGFAYDSVSTDANWPAKTEPPKADPGITLTVAPEQPVYGDAVTITANLPDDATGDITLTVDGIDYTVPVKDGKAVFTVESPDPDEHSVTASYPGDDKYNSASISGTFTVQSAVIAPTGISLDKQEINFTEGSSQVIAAVIEPAGATGTVIWSSSNENAATVTDNNDGTATVTAAGVGMAVITAAIQGTDFSDFCTVRVTEYICPHTNKTEIPAKAATCTEPGNNRYYKCDDCGKYLKADGTTVTTPSAESIPAPGHSYPPFYESDDTQHWQVCSRCYEDSAHDNHTFGAATYTWSADNSICTAKHTCTVCGKEVSETVDSTSQETPATCFADGIIRYTATFTKPGFTIQTTEAPSGESAGHDWGATAYVWSADNSTCTATRVCTRNADHKEEETVNAAVTTTATCTEAGIITCTARFENSAFEVQKKLEATDALGHKDTDNDGVCNTCKKVVDEAKHNDYLFGKVRFSVKSGEVYKNSKVTVIAKASNVPDGYILAVFDGGKEVKRGDRTSVTYEINDPVAQDKTLTVKIIDAAGDVQKDGSGKEPTAKIEIKVKTGFFDIIIAFFKKLFGLNKVTIEP